MTFHQNLCERYKMKLSDYIKQEEDKYRTILPKDLPVIVRIDGSNFSRLTENLDKPYDFGFITLMNNTAKYVIENLSGFRFATVQSDEINICLCPSHEKEEPFYGNNLNKIVSLTAAYASTYFSKYSKDVFKEDKLIHFDSRVFSLSKEDVVGYFIWRQKDTIRNAVQMAARTYFSHKQVTGKNNDEMKEMLKSINKDFDDLPRYFRYGRSLYKVKTEEVSTYDNKSYVRNKLIIDNNSPDFTTNREFISSHV